MPKKKKKKKRPCASVGRINGVNVTVSRNTTSYPRTYNGTIHTFCSRYAIRFEIGPSYTELFQICERRVTSPNAF